LCSASSPARGGGRFPRETERTNAQPWHCSRWRMLAQRPFRVSLTRQVNRAPPASLPCSDHSLEVLTTPRVISMSWWCAPMRSSRRSVLARQLRQLARPGTGGRRQSSQRHRNSRHELGALARTRSLWRTIVDDPSRSLVRSLAYRRPVRVRPQSFPAVESSSARRSRAASHACTPPDQSRAQRQNEWFEQRPPSEQRRCRSCGK